MEEAKGPRYGVHEALGWPEGWLGPGRTGGREDKWFDHKKSLPFLGRVSVQVRLYEKMERGGADGRRW